MTPEQEAILQALEGLVIGWREGAKHFRDANQAPDFDRIYARGFAAGGETCADQLEDLIKLARGAQ